MRVFGFLFAALFAVAPLPLLAGPTDTVRTDIVIGQGMQTTTFYTAKGDVKVQIPDDAAKGDVISGTVVLEPAGSNGVQRKDNGDQLNGYVIEVDKQTFSPSDKYLRWLIPRDLTGDGVPFILRDKTGAAISQVLVPIHPAPAASPKPFRFPLISSVGSPIVIRGPFHGDANGTQVSVGGTAAPILAESPRKVICQNPVPNAGPQEIKIQEGGVTKTGTTNSLDIQLSAPKTNLKRGESTKVHVAVTGLSNIHGAVRLEIHNRSATVISLTGGNEQTVMIHPADVRDGSYSTDRSITAIRGGNFHIDADVLPAVLQSGDLNDKAMDDCLALLARADGLDAEADNIRATASAQADAKNAQAEALRAGAVCSTEVRS
jgi:hypothetical protein